MSTPNAYQAAVFLAGGRTEVAKRLDVTRQTIYRWQQDGIPVERFDAFVEAVDGDPAALLPHVAEFRALAPLLDEHGLRLVADVGAAA